MHGSKWRKGEGRGMRVWEGDKRVEGGHVWGEDEWAKMCGHGGEEGVKGHE